MEEFERAGEKKDGMILRDACGKEWLSAVEVTLAMLNKKGVKDEELPKFDRERGYMVFKYAEEEIELLYKPLRNDLHVEGYYEGLLGFDEVRRNLERLNVYIQKIEELKTKAGNTNS